MRERERERKGLGIQLSGKRTYHVQGTGFKLQAGNNFPKQTARVSPNSINTALPHTASTEFITQLPKPKQQKTRKSLM